MFRQTLTATLLTFMWAASAQAVELQVDDAWVRTAPPTAPARVGYMLLRNPTGETVALVGVTSPQFEKIEMHRTVLQEGMMRMEKVDKIEVPAGGEVRLEPNGYHLMMTGNPLPLATGAQVTFELQWNDGSIQQVIAGVRPTPDKDSGEHRHGSAHPHHDH